MRNLQYKKTATSAAVVWLDSRFSIIGKNDNDAAAISKAIGMRVMLSHLRLPIVSIVLKAGIPKMKLTAPTDYALVRALGEELRA